MLAWGGPNHQSTETGLYHALNRGNLRATIFHKDAEFKEKLRQCQVLFSVIAGSCRPFGALALCFLHHPRAHAPWLHRAVPLGLNIASLVTIGWAEKKIPVGDVAHSVNLDGQIKGDAKKSNGGI